MKQTFPRNTKPARGENGLAEKVRVFKASKGFLQSPEESIRQLALRAVPCQFKKGETIFQEGDPCNYFYIIQKGRVKCFKQSSSGKRLTILIGKRHETLNAGVLFGGQPHIFSATTMEETILLRVERSVYLSWIEDNPASLQKILALIERALGSAYNKLLNIIGETVEHRVYVILYMLYGKFGCSLNFTCKEIAELAGTTTETVIRVISKLKKNQVVTSTRRRIEILNPSEIKSLSHEQHQTHGYV